MNMCAACVTNEVDIAEGISLEAELNQCRGCLRYQSRGKTHHKYSSTSSAWLNCPWESMELMALCLKHIHGLHKAKLIDANFIWTEPHSKRIKVKLTLQREAMNHAIIQNVCVVNYMVHTTKCPDCTKQYHNNTWKALVQIRQKAEHKRTFFRLEQLILEAEAHKDVIGITTVKEGLDFYFGFKNEAECFVRFLMTKVPMRHHKSSKLISQDVRNATANLQTTYCVELNPICKDDLVLLPRKTAQQCRNIARLVLCSRTTSMLHIVDPLTGQKAQVTNEKYWKFPFFSLQTSPNMIEFIVLNVEPVDYSHTSITTTNTAAIATATTSGSKKNVMADIEVARISDFGINDTIFQVRSHLGNILHAGDMVKGYDLSTTVFGISSFMYSSYHRDDLPDIILVRKVYPRERKTISKEKQRLETKRTGKINKNEAAKMEKEFEAFMEEYEQDKEDDDEEEVEIEEEEDYEVVVGGQELDELPVEKNPVQDTKAKSLEVEMEKLTVSLP
jgi:nonsense-mediated mRNA decay protein 3